MKEKLINTSLTEKIDINGHLIFWSEKEDSKGGYLMQYFSPQSIKPQAYIRCKSLEQLLSQVQKYVLYAKERLERKEKQKEDNKKRRSDFLSKLQVGTILSDSWGYDQTNVEFYKVIAINKNKVTIQELGHKDVGPQGGMSTHVMPDDNVLGEIGTYTCGVSGIKLCESVYLTLWNGEKKYKSWYA